MDDGAVPKSEMVGAKNLGYCLEEKKVKNVKVITGNVCRRWMDLRRIPQPVPVARGPFVSKMSKNPGVPAPLKTVLCVIALGTLIFLSRLQFSVWGAGGIADLKVHCTTKLCDITGQDHYRDYDYTHPCDCESTPDVESLLLAAIQSNLSRSVH
jgi:hypothetical protein